jgi:hypothetical protein
VESEVVEMAERNLIEVLLEGGFSKREVERRLAEMALGVVDALREGNLTPEQAYDELFNLDLYQSLINHRFDAEFRDMFECGMQLEDVAEIAPKSLEKNYQKIERMARSFVATTIGAQTHIRSATRKKMDGPKNSRKAYQGQSADEILAL